MKFSVKDRDDAYHCGVLLTALEEQERDPLKRMALANVRNFLNKLQRKLQQGIDLGDASTAYDKGEPPLPPEQSKR